MYNIRVRLFWFIWKKYKVKKHWFETHLAGLPIPARMIIETEKGDIIVLSNILFRDWGMYGIQNTGASSEGIRPSATQLSATDNAQPVLQSDDATGRECSQPTDTTPTAIGGLSSEKSSG